MRGSGADLSSLLVHDWSIVDVMFTYSCSIHASMEDALDTASKSLHAEGNNTNNTKPMRMDFPYVDCEVKWSSVGLTA